MHVACVCVCVCGGGGGGGEESLASLTGRISDRFGCHGNIQLIGSGSGSV